jgi:hypothetical protein
VGGLVVASLRVLLNLQVGEVKAILLWSVWFEPSCVYVLSNAGGTIADFHVLLGCGLDDVVYVWPKWPKERFVLAAGRWAVDARVYPV